MRFQLEFWSDQIEPGTEDKVFEALRVLSNCIRQPVVPSSSAAAVEPAADEAEPAKEEKPKRKRRTKAEIEAEKAAKAESAAAAPAAPAEEPADDPLADEGSSEPVTKEQVKQAVVDVIARLTEKSDPKPTATAVAHLVELTGKKKVSEIEEADYAKTVEGLAKVGV